MATINGRACVVNDTPVDKVFSNGKQVYSRNLLADSGFESGNVPAKYAFGGGQLAGITLTASNRINSTYPSPMGNFMLKMANYSTDLATGVDQYVSYPITPVPIRKGETWTYSYYYASAGSASGQASDYLISGANSPLYALSMDHAPRETSGGQTTWHRFLKTWTADKDVTLTNLRFGFITSSPSPGWLCIDNIKLEQHTAVSLWTPAPEDYI